MVVVVVRVGVIVGVAVLEVAGTTLKVTLTTLPLLPVARTVRLPAVVAGALNSSSPVPTEEILTDLATTLLELPATKNLISTVSFFANPRK